MKDPIDVTLTRETIKVKAVRFRLEGDVGYIRVTSFTEQATSGVLDAVEKIKKEAGPKLKGYVLDLRNNPGGLLDQAISMVDAFVDKGEIVSVKARKAEDVQRWNAKPGDVANGLPIVVLMNGGSASASEIVAGALQDHRRAIILGTRSFGKGSVQTIMQVTGGGAIRLTTALYFTPSGRSIQKEGIKPDIEVEQAKVETIQQRSGFREENLRRSITNPNDKPADKPDDKIVGDQAPADKKEDKPAAATQPRRAAVGRSRRAAQGRRGRLPAAARRRPDSRHLALHQPRQLSAARGGWPWPRGSGATASRWRPARGLVAAWVVVLGLTAGSAAIVFGLVREPPRVAPPAEAAAASCADAHRLAEAAAAADRLPPPVEPPSARRWSRPPPMACACPRSRRAAGCRGLPTRDAMHRRDRRRGSGC